MIQWIGVVIALLGLAYNGVKDYQKGDIKIPKLPKKQVLTKVVYPVQYCLMAYDPNVDKVFYLHENGQWHDYAPQQRRYSTTPQVRQDQGQGQATLGDSYGTQGTSGYYYGQQAQASTNTTRH
jgi:hypothetical protein